LNPRSNRCNKLDPADYARAQGVLQTLDRHLAVQAILAGDVPGARVFVDEPVRPQAALAWTKDHLYLAGSPGNAAFNLPSLLRLVRCGP
jgi:hypothetical protein